MVNLANKRDVLNEFVRAQAGKIIAFVLTACLVAVSNTWLTVHDLDRDYGRIVTFMERGDRFTSADADDLASHIAADIEYLSQRIGELEEEVAAVEERCGILAINMAKLPPPQWQNRILNLEKEHAILKGRLRGSGVLTFPTQREPHNHNGLSR